MIATKPKCPHRFRKADVDEEFFSVRLRQLRQAAGLNQAELAERAGLKGNTVSQLENGVRAPTWKTVLRLAAALGVTCLDFCKDPAGEAQPPPTRRGRPKKPQSDE